MVFFIFPTAHCPKNFLLSHHNKTSSQFLKWHHNKTFSKNWYSHLKRSSFLYFFLQMKLSLVDVMSIYHIAFWDGRRGSMQKYIIFLTTDTFRKCTQYLNNCICFGKDPAKRSWVTVFSHEGMVSVLGYMWWQVFCFYNIALFSQPYRIRLSTGIQGGSSKSLLYQHEEQKTYNERIVT